MRNEWHVWNQTHQILRDAVQLINNKLHTFHIYILIFDNSVTIHRIMTLSILFLCSSVISHMPLPSQSSQQNNTTVDSLLFLMFRIMRGYICI